MSYHVLKVKTNQQQQFVDITSQVKALLDQLQLETGICHLYVPHTTAGVTINEGADPDVVGDILMHLNALVPDSGSFKHREGNSPAHIKSMLVGATKTILVCDGRLVLGTWQKIFFCEFDGPRQRRIGVKFMAG